MRALLLGLVLAGCAGTQSDAALSTEMSCQRAMAQLRHERAAGTPCEVARTRVLDANPGCQLIFTCPARDGGAE